MAKPVQITPLLSVSPQIAEADLELLAARGFRAIVNNRPDGEAADQPAGAVIAAAAQRRGLDYRAVPVVPGQIGEEDVAAFARALAEAKGPVLAYCRTGTRSISLWALSEAERRAPDDILAAASAAGYDLSALRPRLEARWRAAR